MPVIAISGQAGSGKTTVAKAIAERLGLKLVSAGRLFRRLAEERGMGLVDFHTLAEKDLDIDRRLDGLVRDEAVAGDVVVEGHVAAWIVRDVADVALYLKADVSERARRVALRDGKPVDVALREIVERESSNKKRYYELYRVDVERDLHVFDLVIDTTYIDADTACSVALTYVEGVLRGRGLLRGRYNL